MSRKLVLLVFISYLVVTTLVSRTTYSQFLSNMHGSISQSEGVHNLDSGLNYTTIQEAIDAPETLDGHAIFVDAGTYYEDVVVNKAISLIGEDKNTTVIDGDGSLVVLAIDSDGVSVSGFTVTHSYGKDGWGGGGLVVGGVGNVQISDIIACYNDADWGVHLVPDGHDINITRTIVVNNSRGGLVLHRTWKVNVYNNTIVSNKGAGISLMSAGNNNTVSGNNIANNRDGIRLADSSNNTILGNNVTANEGNGFFLDRGENNSISDNNIAENYIGFSLQSSCNNTLFNNHMANNTYNFAIYANTLSDFMQKIDPSNTVGGKPVYYWVDEENKEIPSDAGHVTLVNSRNITVQDLNLTHNSHGVLLAFTSNSTVKNVTTAFNGIGISLQASYNNTLIGNVASNNTQYGIALSDSGGNVLRNNTMTDNAIINFGVIPIPGLMPTPSTFINDVDPSNKVDGKPIYYWVNQSNRHVPSDAGCVLIVNSTDITVSNLTLTDNVFGVGLIYSTNSLVRNVTVQNNMIGFSVLFSNTTTIANNTIGDNSHGIVLTYSHYNKVLRNSIKNNENGIYLQYSNNNMLTRNNVTHNIFGIQLDYSDRNELIWNRVANNTEGIRLQKSYANMLTLNNITANINSGLDLANSGSNTLRNNSLTDNQWNFGIWGDALSDFINDVDTSNTVNDNTIVYLINKTNLIINPSTFPQVGCLVLVNSTNITVQSFTLANNYESLTFAYTSDSAIANITATNNIVSLLLWNSNNNTITANTMRDNWFGPLLGRSNDNKLTNNNITNNSQGIVLFDKSHNNTLVTNFVKNNSYGVYLRASEENTFYHNNFINNTNQADIRESFNNTWDDGIEGNYWSDYYGFDLDDDGIGDSWYEIDENNTDHCPLMAMVSNFNTSLGYPVNVISNSTIEDFEYSDSTIRLRVSNMTANQTGAFCRIRIPHNVVSPPYNVTINDNPVAHTTIYENETLGLSIIYFSYQHSTLEITIVPEFPSSIILPLFMAATLLTVIMYRRKHQLASIKK